MATTSLPPTAYPLVAPCASQLMAIHKSINDPRKAEHWEVIESDQPFPTLPVCLTGSRSRSYFYCTRTSHLKTSNGVLLWIRYLGPFITAFHIAQSVDNVVDRSMAKYSVGAQFDFLIRSFLISKNTTLALMGLFTACSVSPSQ